jgi:ABC-type phosphate/phosphonate transport system ATPase subunit
VTLAAGHLAHSKIAKRVWDTFPQEKSAFIIEAIAALDLSAAFLGKAHMYSAGEAIV